MAQVLALTRAFDIGFGAFVVLFVVLVAFVVRFVAKVGRRRP
jgi:hypothetical protein